MTVSERRRRIERASQQTIESLKRHVHQLGRLCVVKAPPGSGKTHTLLEAVGEAVRDRRRVAIAAQTNAQCDDICRRYAERFPQQRIWRFAAKDVERPGDMSPTVEWIKATHELPADRCVVVGTTAKWSMVKDFEPFDFLFVDEAWQMAWADFMLLGTVSERFVLIGDPGQIPPVVTVPVARWETSPRAPHRAAPDLILEDPTIDKLALELDACRRLPSDSVDLVRSFYDFSFEAWAEAGERYVRPKRRGSGAGVDAAIDMLDHASSAIVTLETPDTGPPLELDPAIAELAALVATRALERECVAADDDSGNAVALQSHDIGIAATHRVVNSAITAALPAKYRDPTSGIRVDTPERWQGLERKLMIVVHPLSGVVHPSDFDLETGRLCVMASRHRSGMVVVSRNHVPETLASHIPWAEQAVGRPDVTGRGHFQHTTFWQAHADAERVVAVPT